MAHTVDMQKINFFVEENIARFHQRKLEYVRHKMDFDTLLQQKNPYLFRAKNILTSFELVKGFVDAFLQSQEETLFGEFIESLAIFVCDQVYGAKKSSLTGMDLEFETKDILYVVEIKAGWNWGNASQLKQLKINAASAKKSLENCSDKEVRIINGCCFGKKKNRSPEKSGYYKICGQEFWHLISNDEDFYTRIIEPIGHKAKERNEEFTESYSVILNNFTDEFSQRFCENGKINWIKLLEFNSGRSLTKKKKMKKL
jgi:hypothetical protein